MATDTSSVELVPGDVVAPFARAALLAALLGAVSWLSIPYPLSSAPVTLQVLVVFLAGLYLGPLWGSVSMGLYLAAGLLGAPVFQAGNAGFGYVAGPTGGYLLGFLVAALLIGALVHRGVEPRDPATRSLPTLVGAMLAGTIVLYALGATWMAYALELSISEAIVVGAVVFLPWELLEMAAAVGIVRSGVVEPT